MPITPKIYVVAGPNGAGKTTFAKKFLPDYTGCREFVNADLIAAGLSPLNPDAAATTAGRLMLEQIHKLASQKRDFAFETTLSGLHYAQFFTKLKKQGYKIHIFYLWVPGVSLALKRIAARVRAGGHNVPSKIVARRYKKSLCNLFHRYWMIADTISFIDNSASTPRLVAIKNNGDLHIYDAETFSFIKGAAK